MIQIKNLNKKFTLNGSFVKKLAAEILKSINKDIDLEIVFLDDRAITRLNKEYKKLDRPTDVLSFKLDRREFGQKGGLGDIFISLDTARRNAKIYSTRFEDEIVLYVIHGILHLFGYDDETVKSRARMSKRQGAVLEGLCNRENLSRVLTRQ